jgi:AcrR family transcriptional regulator
MSVTRNNARPYRQSARADRYLETRQRIVEAAVELHLERGPVRTSIGAIAERAGVSRITVYRHFPDARTLLEACARHSREANPPPDLERWQRIADPRARMQFALTELYGYFRRTEAGWSNILRDAELVPLVKELAEERRVAYLRRARDLLLAGRPERGRDRRLLRAALGLAVDFRTWQTLARQGLSDRDAAMLMLQLVGGVGDDASSRSGAERATVTPREGAGPAGA